MRLFAALLGASHVKAFDVDEHVEGYRHATKYVNQHPDQFSSLISRLDDAAFLTRWNTCNTNGDEILDFQENQSCVRRVAEAYGFQDSLGEIMQQMMSDAEIRKFYGGYYNADRSQTYEQYKHTEGMSVLAGVYTIYLVHDLNQDNFLSPKELGAAWEAGKTRLHINPEMEAWVNANRGQYKRLWGMSDTDGNYRTANILELANFQLATSQLAFEHFILHEN
ncbi:Oidioi.mRNA.OKI2018_I69.chr1.g3747.t1.cds [Oikopleura dioica]|uniref:Oidioi.mRNA.OKI2018_I69.chr1.g3747.t1.cds n=1 Tax=Oikopleura dioica TaxID=34765 RepID=A0ABN7SV10_OIKDI|nr:Oidioi.mRNA.OKI2018_I69.chr1.g3747.t1.cds [Oikopleura dioica]